MTPIGQADLDEHYTRHSLPWFVKLCRDVTTHNVGTLQRGSMLEVKIRRGKLSTHAAVVQVNGFDIELTADEYLVMLWRYAPPDARPGAVKRVK